MLIKLYIGGRVRQDVEYYSMLFRSRFGANLVTDERSLYRYLAERRNGIPYGDILTVFGVTIKYRCFHWEDYTWSDDPC